MHSAFETAPVTPAIPISFVTKATWDAVAADLASPGRQFALANGFNAKPGSWLALPDANGEIAQIIFGLDSESGKFRDPFRPGQLPGLLPPGVYRFTNVSKDQAHLATLAFALGCYRFGRYRNAEPPEVRLVPPDGVDIADVSRMANAAARRRTPASALKRAGRTICLHAEIASGCCRAARTATQSMAAS